MKKNFLLVILSIALTGGFCYFQSYNNVFNWGDWCTAGGIANLFNAPLVFVLLLRIPTTKMPKWTVFLIHLVAKVSLPIYLVSYIFDSWWYPILDTRIAFGYKLMYYPLSIAVIFGASFVLALVVEKVSSMIYKGLGRIFEKCL